LDLIDELHAEGATIVVITHDRGIAGRLPRQIEMIDGLVVADTLRLRSGREAAWPEAWSAQGWKE
jgi:ABC-type lipoprotein export system ATPase subunit